MESQSPLISTHFLMHNKYSVNTKRLLKSNYKYKRRPPFEVKTKDGPQQQNAHTNHRNIHQQHHSMHQQQQNNKIFSLIYQSFLTLIKLLIYQLATRRQEERQHLKQKEEQEEFITINNVNSNYAAIHELNAATATLATKSCKLLQSKLSNYKLRQQQQQKPKPLLPLAPLTHADIQNCHNWCCYCWSFAVARLSNFSSLLSMLLAKLRPAAITLAQRTTSALSGTSTRPLTAMTATSTPAATPATSKHCWLSMWHSHRGISVNLLVMTLFIALLTTSIDGVAGGACWKSALDNGKCSEIFSMNITRSDCCRISSEFSYTERQLTSIEFFFATSIGGGMECAPCVESCKSVKCGVNKKCVKRKGRPKCICAPECGAAKRRKQQQRLLMRQYNARRDIRSLSSEIKHNYNLELNQFSRLLSQQQQQQQPSTVEENQRNMQILQSQSQPAKQQQRRRIIIANAEPTPAAKRRIQIFSNAEPHGGVGGGGGRNRHRLQSEGRHRQLDNNNRHPTMSRHYHHQADSNELLPINGKQEKRRHRHHQQSKQQRPAEHAPNVSQEQNKQRDERRRKHHKHQEQSQQAQRQRHRQHKIKDHMQNSTTTMTAAVANLTLLTSTTSSSSSALSTSPPTITPLHSGASAIDKHLNVVNHGSNFATSSLSPSSTASGTATATSTQLLSGGVADRMSDSKNNYNEDKQDHDRKHGSNGMATIIANVQQHEPNAVIDSGSGSGITSSTAAFNTNHDMTTFLDGVSDQYNLHGFPNQQYSIMHSEHFHGGHPVCGTDGRTYNTECQLKKRACRTNNSNLQVAYRGYCKSSCMGVKCLHGRTCVEDNYHIPHCIICNIQCPHDTDTTSAMDNELHLKNYNKIMTLMQGPTTMTNKGSNHVFRNDESHTSESVCGVDGKTYKSICDINRMICKIGRAIAVAYPGPCRADVRSCQDINCGPQNTCLVDYLTHQPRCISCRYKCSRKRRPMSLRFEEGKLCGVNNRTYNSWCEMRKDSCSTGYFIDVRTPGECGIA